VEYAFNFYILKPIDLSKGARKMMYEPPNRGGKTWAALGRVAVDPGGNVDDPGSAITNPTRARQLVPHAARLHHRVEWVGGTGQSRQPELQLDGQPSDRAQSRRLIDHRPVL
jgi:hypothetical protein